MATTKTTRKIDIVKAPAVKKAPVAKAPAAKKVTVKASIKGALQDELASTKHAYSLAIAANEGLQKQNDELAKAVQAQAVAIREHREQAEKRTEAYTVLSKDVSGLMVKLSSTEDLNRSLGRELGDSAAALRTMTGIRDHYKNAQGASLATITDLEVEGANAMRMVKIAQDDMKEANSTAQRHFRSAAESLTKLNKVPMFLRKLFGAA